MGAIRERGVFGEIHTLWPAIIAARTNGFVDHYHGERNHQGKENKLLFQRELIQSGPVHCRERLGGLLKYYVRAALVI
jgi:hypothetical protein